MAGPAAADVAPLEQVTVPEAVAIHSLVQTPTGALLASGTDFDWTASPPLPGAPPPPTIVWRSTDGGQTWARTGTLSPPGGPLLSTDEDLIALRTLKDNGDAAFWTSHNDGRTWSLVGPQTGTKTASMADFVASSSRIVGAGHYLAWFEPVAYFQLWPNDQFPPLHGSGTGGTWGGNASTPPGYALCAASHGCSVYETDSTVSSSGDGERFSEKDVGEPGVDEYSTVPVASGRNVVVYQRGAEFGHGSGGRMLRSLDGGLTWTAADVAQPLESLLPGPGESFIATLPWPSEEPHPDGLPLRLEISRDAGLTWVGQDLPISGALAGTLSPGGGAGWATVSAEDGSFHLLQSTDVGATWSDVTPPNLPADAALATRSNGLLAMHSANQVFLGGVVRAGFDILPGSGALDVELDASRSRGPVERYTWSFGDGSSGNGQRVTHSFPAPGTYSVRLTAEGSDGTRSLRTQTVEVGAPTAAATLRQEGRTVPARVIFDARASLPSAPDAPIDRYEWDFDADGRVDYSGPRPEVGWVYTAPVSKAYAVLRVRDQDRRWSAPVRVGPVNVAHLKMLAMGDSVAAGHGNDWDDVLGFDVRCRQAPTHNYSGQAWSELRRTGLPLADADPGPGFVKLLACSGARTFDTPARDPGDQVVDLVSQLPSDDGTGEIVTITGTANDVVFGYRIAVAGLLGPAATIPIVGTTQWALEKLSREPGWQQIVRTPGATLGDLIVNRFWGSGSGGPKKYLPPLQRTLVNSRATLARAIVTAARKARSDGPRRAIFVTDYYGGNIGNFAGTRRGLCASLRKLGLPPDKCAELARIILKDRNAGSVRRFIEDMNRSIALAVLDAQAEVARLRLDGRARVRLVDIAHAIPPEPEYLYVDPDTSVTRWQCLIKAAKNPLDPLYCAGLGHPTVAGQGKIAARVVPAVQQWWREEIIRACAPAVVVGPCGRAAPAKSSPRLSLPGGSSLGLASAGKAALVPLACPASATAGCSGIATLASRSAGKAASAAAATSTRRKRGRKRARQRVALLGRADFTIERGDQQAVAIKLTKAGRRLAGRAKGVHATLTLVTRVTGRAPSVQHMKVRVGALRLPRR